MMTLSAPHWRAFRAALVSALFAAWFASGAAAQQTVSSVRIYAEPAGASFSVDGVEYRSAATFLWAANTKHELRTLPLQYSTSIKARYTFQGWNDSAGLLNSPALVQTVIADPAITYIRASFKVEYALSLVFFNCPSSEPGACDSPGTVYVGGQPFTANAELYFEAGTTVPIQVYANPGFLFTGYSQGTGNAVQAYLKTVTMDTPRVLYPRFERSGYLTLETSPPGFQVLADRSPVVAPVTLEWGAGTTHTVGVVSPQRDRQGNLWVFSSWSDGGNSTHAYTMPADLQTARQKLTVVFVQAGRISFLTSPPGLKLKVDGVEKWQSYNFDWAPGTRHRVEAPERQTDLQGRTWVFQSWSNGGPAIQEVSAPEDTNLGLRMTAVYEPLVRITVETSPPGIAVEADGQACATPCVLERLAGAVVRLRAAAAPPAGEGVRLDFEGWADGAGPEREYTVPPEPVILRAVYRQRFRLALGTEPADAARFSLEPAGADGYYDAGQAVVVTLEPKPGFRFRGWQGDLSGTARTVSLAMTAPRYATAVFQAVPYVPPDGVQNAAGVTPDAVVAPGSIAAIVGVNLATETKSGPESPLAQTLAGVLVRYSDRILPLFFVSPEQINVQLPADLEEGEQKLAIRRDGQPETTVTFTVARNAPGLFAVEREGRAFCLAAHGDGSAVTSENPARRGEVITLFGTGFGPYNRRPPEGFAVPRSPEYRLVDPVEVVAGETVLAPEFAGAAPGHVGMNAIRVRIGDELPGGSIEIRARVNGRESNTVLLPIELPAPAEVQDSETSSQL